MNILEQYVLDKILNSSGVLYVRQKGTFVKTNYGVYKVEYVNNKDGMTFVYVGQSIPNDISHGVSHQYLMTGLFDYFQFNFGYELCDMDLKI
jgi:uncharacterized protein YydD (DUF2326 family)